MLYLLLTVLTTIWIFICFKGFSIYQIRTLQAITINYITCIITGLIFTGLEPIYVIEDSIENWLFLAIFIGLNFVGAFYLLSICTQKVGVGITTLASRISLVIPVIFSLFIFETQSRDFSVWNYIGLGIGFLSVILSSYKGSQIGTPSKNYGLPILIFFLAGYIDTVLNYANTFLTSEADRLVFPIVVFVAAASGGILGTTYNYFKKNIKLQPKSILAGVILGIPNYFSIYFLIKTLEAYQNNGAFVFPVFNILTILGSTILGIVLFKEKPSRGNYIGLAFAINALILLLKGEVW